MLNLAVRGHDVSGISKPEQLAEAIASKNIGNVQFALSASFPEWSAADKINPGMGTFFKQTFEAKHIQIALLSCYSNLIHPDAATREDILKKFEQYLFHARYFGASMVASETGSVLAELGYSEANFNDDVFDDLIEVVQRLVSVGEQHQTMVGIEAGLNHPLYSNHRIAELIERVPSPYLGIIYDPTNLITAETAAEQVSIVKEAFEMFGDKIVCLHLKDYQVEKNVIVPVPLGEGQIAYKEILSILQEKKPLCYIVLEETKDAGIERAVALLEDFH
ncbi:sugar phosphate isomerase/epimerase family protein [Enterococcus sp. DIV0876]|uniref:sugar phosphate isomerase/epimerase family protein n=1 Tax=Enterococcus sp. DIV0876 TaxID=2774633 RepID=UPI003D2FC2C2